MNIVDWYPEIKMLHVSLALTSGALFALRGVGVLLGVKAAMAALPRYGSMVIDSVLLASAVLLLVALQLNPLATPWLQAKLTLLLLYIVFGTLALRRAPSQAGKAAAFIAALLCFAMMLVIARTHDPAGVLRMLGVH